MEYAIVRMNGKFTRVYKDKYENHESAFKKAITLSVDNELSPKVKWSIACAKQMKEQFGLEYNNQLESFLMK